MGNDLGGLRAILYGVALALLLLMSAFFSASETAFTSMNVIRMKSRQGEGDRRAARALRLAEDFDRLLTTILVGNNIVNILSTSLATVLFVRWLGNLGVTVSTVTMTVLVVLFGEVCPKSMAKEEPERFAMFAAPALRAIQVVLTPLVFLLVKIKSLFARAFRSREEKAAITESEILTFVETAEQEGGIDEQESELIRSAVEFGDITAGEIATPRVDVVAVEQGSSVHAIADAFLDSGFSRLPVYVDNLDNVVGVLHQKDFFRFLLSGEGSLEALMQKPLFVTEYMKLQDLMAKMRAEQEHIAFVLDEYGGVTGLVTFEDVLEELVGEIWDEHDDVVEDVVDLGEGRLRVSGGVDFDELAERLGLEAPPEDADYTSVGGWVMDQLKKIPAVGDEFTCDGWRVRVTQADDRRVQSVVLTKQPIETE